MLPALTASPALTKEDDTKRHDNLERDIGVGTAHDRGPDGGRAPAEDAGSCNLPTTVSNAQQPVTTAPNPSAAFNKSQLGPMLDPTGRGVSQLTIVIDNINLNCDKILVTCKDLHSVAIELMKRQVALMDTMKKFSILDDDVRQDAMEFMEQFQDSCNRELKCMEMAKALWRAYPRS